ncbi:hypothetical protein HH214_21310 [Mucilaginibacter robiniae]|uniref:D-isomer specific 2-hydroxyacid dehydrogenase NAD-binding domain-containing protein n=1 Tax=Mucilaginibacter robiniae TaxID=2728022 RepID=A0A7L5E6A0_9SPHI|nr:hypothetical protein HH214_21310 [Mucilaginibacter robiniae]
MNRNLKNKKIAGVALDVYDTEPLPADYPLRKLDTILATPHVGYVTEDIYRVFYGDTVKVIEELLRERLTLIYGNDFI